MKITVENLGILKQAEFEVGDLTIICGANNTGKTYITYALFGFLYSWEQNFTIDGLNQNDSLNQKIDELLRKGTVKIDIDPYIEDSDTILAQMCSKYSTYMPTIFASRESYFNHSKFEITLPQEKLQEFISSAFKRNFSSQQEQLFLLSKEAGNKHLLVTAIHEKDTVALPYAAIHDIISETIGDILFGNHFPNPFIVSSERTGAAIFRKELDFARNRLLEEMSKTAKATKNIDPIELLFNSYRRYALPVTNNVDFTRRLDEIEKKESFIAKEHPDILNNFADIIGGKYIVSNQDNEIYFKPSKASMKLTMNDSSSAVRSLVNLGFYLRHTAKRGDLLMIDEPELNLHPENQRRIARLLARLVNLGIKVFITTHSDYIIKEFNTLIMLSEDDPYIKEIAQKEKYHPEELLQPNKIRAYIAEQALIKVEDGKRRRRHNTITPAPITSEYGIEVGSFDKSIDDMNRIQDLILNGS